MRAIIGVDEAGRGPLAGPVSVGVALIHEGFDWSELCGVNDSKQLTPKKRETLFRQAQILKQNHQIDFAVAMMSAKTIDRIGIVPAIRRALSRALQHVMRTSGTIDPADVFVKLDGGLYAPSTFSLQETIIRGDATEPAISLASIVAKVTRDRYMVQQSKKAIFKAYGFAEHKGYGTKIHRESIAEYGLSPLHRQTFCRNSVLQK